MLVAIRVGLVLSPGALATVAGARDVAGAGYVAGARRGLQPESPTNVPTTKEITAGLFEILLARNAKKRTNRDVDVRWLSRI